ncbi:MAG: gliding motility-associated C-terminal domain-containing protein, partial [Bacteroidetes bacterium]|nr:gliding motility-associated C-terminal domain-containing protein [Bacteroidota bacterium]
YTWGFDGGTIVSGSGQGPYSIEWNTAGAKNLTLDVVDNGCTSAQITQSITVNNNPVADAGADITVCSGGSVQIGAPAIGTYTYQWNPAADLSSSTTADPTFSSTNTTPVPVINQLVLGVIENGCFDFDTVDITLNPVAPTTISASGPVSFCDGGSVTLTADSVYVTYLWSNTTVGNTITTSQSGTFFMTGADANGCQYLSNSITVTVNPAPVLSLVSSQDETCFGDNDGSITVNATGGQSPYNFDWNTTPVQSGATASNLAAGSYDAIATDGNGCADTATYTISSPAQLILNIDNVTGASCFGFTDASVTVSTTGGNSPYTYNWSNGSVGSILSNVGAGTYSVTVNDINNCSETSSMAVAEPQQFTLATLSFDSIPFGTELPIDLNVQPAGTYTYEWSPANYLSCDDCASPVFSAIRNSAYTVTVTDVSGCTVTATINVNVDAQKPVFIPNVFTPNGDNANDVFSVFVNNVTYYSLMVFNRSGEKVFDSFNENTGWDGFYRGKEAPPGVYVYVVNVTFLDGENQRFKGTVTLLR